jgi:hypothetical protein
MNETNLFYFFWTITKMNKLINHFILHESLQFTSRNHGILFANKKIIYHTTFSHQKNVFLFL